MICERGGCPGSGGNQPHPIYAVLMFVPLIAFVAIAKLLGYMGG